MATHDYVIANQTAANLRTDLNNALQAIVTQNSSATAPADTFANMIWYDTANKQIKKRNEANTAWITVGTIDEGTGKFTPNAAITTSEIAAATLVTASETIGSNNNDTTIPTSAAVKAYADATVLTTTAGASQGAVGTYALLMTWGATVNYGSTLGGSGLFPAGVWKGSSAGTNNAPSDNNGDAWMAAENNARSGTWRCMGYLLNSPASVTLWLRIS